ncbi:xanthine dehydrogenase family protein molybdopterin-binding subunit [Amycolatopsis jejuensis]|uniref:xanthine dehydrogenase family protein molybdopterin-binding subunit n=1 Tax=Amycolatopsis jejuensis TaxID=330084 RepID=UPI000A051B37|nr:xanthine dehydrogenase family protein molybdopterin-binding subunit [Amycolatopsis jejuensis]
MADPHSAPPPDPPRDPPPPRPGPGPVDWPRLAAPEPKSRNVLGKSVLRKEDAALLTGRAHFIDDIEPLGTLHVAMVRSPVPHARIESIDTTAARAVPGVHAVLTGAELRAHTRPQPVGWRNIENQRDTGSYAMATDKVRYVGQVVAAVVADSRALAEDGAELVEVTYAELPVVLDIDEALAPDAPRLFDHWPDNVLASSTNSFGDIDDAFATAEVIVTEQFKIGRDFACPLETRGMVATWHDLDEPGAVGAGRLDFWVSTQSPHRVRETLSEVLGIPIGAVRVQVPSVGGGFGSKSNYYGDDVVCAVLSKLTGRPVKYIEDRNESFVATSHAREQRIDVELAARRDGTLLGLRAQVVGVLGGEVSSVGMGPVWITTVAMPGPYRIPAVEITATGVMTNRAPYGSFRGWGQPKANFAMERMIDVLAAELGIDPNAIRFANLVPAEQLPYSNGLGWVFDSGDFAAGLRRCIELVQEHGWTTEHHGAQRVGIGYATYVEPTGMGVSRSIATALKMNQAGFDEEIVRMDSTGRVTVFTGQSDMGQGVRTTLAQVCAETLGVPYSDVQVRYGDTDSCPYSGYGTGGSRAATLGSVAVHQAAQQVRDQVLAIAAHQLTAASEELTIEDGIVRVIAEPERMVPVAEVAHAAYRRIDRMPPDAQPTLIGRAVYDPPARSFSYGSVAVRTEVDTETGHVRVTGFVMVDDCGVVINPGIVKGQIRGACAMALGGALLQELVYAPDGQPQTTTFLDYRVPTAAEVPDFVLDHLESPAAFVLTGVKGVGEAGTICGLAAVAASIDNALGPARVRVTTLPATPERVRDWYGSTLT